MAIGLESLKSGVRRLPPRIIIHGPEKIGKSTLASQLPSPAFIQTERGSGELDLTSFTFDDGREVARTAAEVREAISFLAEKEHPFRSVVIDSGTGEENLLHQELCTEYGEPNIVGNLKGSKFAYEAGIRLAAKEWASLLSGLDYLCEERKMIICLICHTAVTKFKAPDTEDYDYYEIDVEKKYSCPVLKKWADVILFANFEKPTLIQEDQGFNKKKAKARADEEPGRVIYTERRHAHTAGNRYSLPFQLPFEKTGTMDLILAHIGGKLAIEEEPKEKKHGKSK